MKPRSRKPEGVSATAPGKVFFEEWMISQGWSAEDLGGELGVTRQTIYKYCAQNHRFNPVKLARIAKVFKTTVPRLFAPPDQASTRPSIDKVVASVSDDDFEAIFTMAKRFAERGGAS